jgi:hypothetical protein
LSCAADIGGRRAGALSGMGCGGYSLATVTMISAVSMPRAEP